MALPKHIEGQFGSLLSGRTPATQYPRVDPIQQISVTYSLYPLKHLVDAGGKAINRPAHLLAGIKPAWADAPSSRSPNGKPIKTRLRY
jgi:hypothetical protein